MRPGLKLKSTSPISRTPPWPDHCRSIPSPSKYLHLTTYQTRHIKANSALPYQPKYRTCRDTGLLHLNQHVVFLHRSPPQLRRNCRTNGRQRTQCSLSPPESHSGFTLENCHHPTRQQHRHGVHQTRGGVEGAIIGVTLSGSSGSPSMTLLARFFEQPLTLTSMRIE